MVPRDTSRAWHRAWHRISAQQTRRMNEAAAPRVSTWRPRCPGRIRTIRPPRRDHWACRRPWDGLGVVGRDAITTPPDRAPGPAQQVPPGNAHTGCPRPGSAPPPCSPGLTMVARPPVSPAGERRARWTRGGEASAGAGAADRCGARLRPWLLPTMPSK